MKIKEKNEETLITTVLEFTKGEMKVFLDTAFSYFKQVNYPNTSIQQIYSTLISKNPSDEFEEILQKLYKIINNEV